MPMDEQLQNIMAASHSTLRQRHKKMPCYLTAVTTVQAEFLGNSILNLETHD